MTHHAKQAVTQPISNQEPGYKAVLVREETKQRLQQWRKTLTDRDWYQERRLVTAALELCLGDEELQKRMLAIAKDVVLREVNER